MCYNNGVTKTFSPIISAHNRHCVFDSTKERYRVCTQSTEYFDIFTFPVHVGEDEEVGVVINYA